MTDTDQSSAENMLYSTMRFLAKKVTRQKKVRFREFLLRAGGHTGLAMSHDSLGNRADAQSAFEHALSTDSLKTPLARYARRRTEELMAYD